MRSAFGQHGFAITLPRNRWEWEERVRQLKGEHVCVSPDSPAQLHEPYFNSLDSNVEDRQAHCSSSDGTWAASEPFVDKYTRILAVTFNLYNGNDFDWDEEEKDLMDHFFKNYSEQYNVKAHNFVIHEKEDKRYE